MSHELPEHNDDYELHRLLGALLSDELPLSEKFSIVEGEYNIPVENVIEREVGVMCNLSQGIKEKGIAIGEARIIKRACFYLTLTAIYIIMLMSVLLTHFT